MKVAVVNSYDKINVRLRNEIETLKSVGFDVDVYLLKRGNAGKKERTFDNRYLNVRICTVRSALVGGSRSSVALFVPAAYLSLIKTIFSLEYDVIHICHPALLPVGLFLGKAKGCKIIYDCFELHSLSLSYRFPIKMFRPYIKKIAQFFEGVFVQHTDGIVTIDTAYDYLYATYRKKNNNVGALKNVPDLRIQYDVTLFELLKRQYEDRKIFICIGGISKDKCVEEIVRAAKGLKPEFPQICILFLGRFRDDSRGQIEDYIKDAHLEETIYFVDWEKYHRMLSYLAISFTGIALYRPIPQYYLSRGNVRRIYTYMGACLPTIVSDFGEIGKVVQEKKCGLLVDPKSPDRIAAAMRYLLKNPEKAKKMGENAGRAVHENLNWGVEQTTLLSVYKNVFKEEGIDQLMDGY